MTGPLKRGSSQELFVQIETDILRKSSDKAHWSKARRLAVRLNKNAVFQLVMSFLIMVNMAFVIIEVNLAARKEKSPQWLVILNLVVLAVYAAEAGVRIFGLRMDVFRDKFAMADIFVVLLDISVTVAELIMPLSLAPAVVARVARVMKLTRALRALSVFPELNTFLKGMFLASGTVLWGLVLLTMAIGFFSIFATLFIHPVAQELEEIGIWEVNECKRCSRAFESVQMSMLTFTQQIIMGEGWSDLVTPMVEERPWTLLFFIGVMVTMTLAALNLLMGAIVERAMEAQTVTAKELAEKKDRTKLEASKQLYAICRALDGDGSGRLSLDELKTGFFEHQGFAELLATMDIEEHDLDTVFRMLDLDKSGDVEYREFVDQLHQLKNLEPNTLLCFIKYYVQEIHRQMEIAGGMMPSASLPKAKESDLLEEPPESSCDRPQLGASKEERSLPPSPSSWPQLEAELQKLADLQHEVSSFSRLQVQELDMIHRRLLATLRDPTIGEAFGHAKAFAASESPAPVAVEKAVPAPRGTAVAGVPAPRAHAVAANDVVLQLQSCCGSRGPSAGGAAAVATEDRGDSAALRTTSRAHAEVAGERPVGIELEDTRGSYPASYGLSAAGCIL